MRVPKKEDLAVVFAIIIIGMFVVIFALDALGRDIGKSRYVVGSLILVVAGWLLGPKLIGKTPPNKDGAP